jgi:hypothetical protein
MSLLLYRQLSSHDPGGHPPQVDLSLHEGSHPPQAELPLHSPHPLPCGLEELRQLYSSNLGFNKCYFRELARCLKTIDVPVILLKGAALLPTVYNDLGVKSLVDFDLLIHHKDLGKISSLLADLGYKPCGGTGPYVNKTHFVRYGGPGLPLEVHWHVECGTFPNFEAFNMERFWRDAIPIRVEDYQGLALSPHHQLLHLSVHALRHSYLMLIYLWEMHAVINHYKEGLDWEELVREARELQLSRPIFYGLYLTRLFINTDLPQDVLDRLRPQDPNLGDRAFLHFIHRGIRRSGLQYLVYLSMCQGVADKLRFLRWSLLPPRDVLAEMSEDCIEEGSEAGIIHYLRCLGRRSRSALELLLGGREA